jgi:predicted DNA-binding protein
MKRYMKGSKEKSDGKFKRTALFFRAEQMEKLQLLSSASGAPVAELVRRAVDSYLEHRRGELEPTKKSK